MYFYDFKALVIDGVPKLPYFSGFIWLCVNVSLLSPGKQFHVFSNCLNWKSISNQKSKTTDKKIAISIIPIDCTAH